MTDFNFIYKKLVQGPDDVVGALAYGLYKEEKIAFLTSFREEHGRDATEEELKTFHRVANVPLRIDAYKSQAESLLQEFLDDVLGAALVDQQQSIERNALVGVMKAHNDHMLSAVQGKFNMLKGIAQNIVAGIVTTGITFGFVLAAWMWNEGPDNIMSNAIAKYKNGAKAEAEVSNDPAPAIKSK